MYSKKTINCILIALVALDLALCVVCLFFPKYWFLIMHGIEGEDTLGMVRRLGAVWLAFFGLQLLALKRWEREPYWLVLIAGVRWTELFSDWVYWYFASSLSWFGHFGLLISPPSNILIGFILLRTYQATVTKAR